ncbi:MAG: hypothetical protein JNK16_13990 [Phycisphaerales bacterium]|nr:hypothetical protein [Phycisphaerales bacterium]
MSMAEKDILISRVVDGVAGAGDWVELDMLGAADSSLWRELAQAQRDKQLLDQAVGEAISIADVVALPKSEWSELGDRRLRVPQWAGWAAAAVLAIAMFVMPRGGTPTGNTAGTFFPPAQMEEQTPDAALSSYLAKGKDEGRVIRQLPEFVVLESKPAADGLGYDVVYLRQIVERARVESVNSYQVDDAGRKLPLPVKVIEPKQPV